MLLSFLNLGITEHFLNDVFYPNDIKRNFFYYEVLQRTCQPASHPKITAIIQQVTKPVLVQKHPFVAELGMRLSKPLIILDYWRNPQD